MKKIAFLLAFLFILCLPGCAKSKPVEPLVGADYVLQISSDAYQERFNSVLTDGLQPIKQLESVGKENSGVEKAVLENSISIYILGQKGDDAILGVQLSIADNDDIVRFVDYAMCVFLSFNPTATDEQKQEFKEGLETFKPGVIYDDLENNIGYAYDLVNDNITVVVGPGK